MYKSRLTLLTINLNMNFNFIVVVVLVSGALFYIKFTEIFYRYCTTHDMIKYKNKNDTLEYCHSPLYEHVHLNTTTSKVQHLENLCKESQVDYESHLLMSMSIDRLNEFILAKDVLDPETLDSYIRSVDVTNLKLSLLFLKFIYIALYVSMLYLIIIVIPNYLLQFALSLLNKILMLIFFLLFIESVMKIYFQLNTDLISFINRCLYLQYVEYFPVDYIVRFYRLITEYITKFIN
jgi:hypothetical protein